MFDFIVIGGGPAGSSAARKAASRGLATLLLEKERFPRYKPCGGAVSDKALSYLDFELPHMLYTREVWGIRIVYKGQIKEKYFPERMGILVNRESFDDYLLKMAGKSGADIIVGEKVVDVVEEGKGVKIVADKREYEARYAVIAEGAQGKLKHKVREKDPRNAYAISLVTEIEEDNGRIDDNFKAIIEIHAGLLKRGFGWVFPHHRYYSVGVAGLAKYFDKPRDKMAEFLRGLGYSSQSRITAHLIPAGGIQRRLTTSRVVLAGDAAGFVDAFYGEGLSYAIRSGQIAGELISRIIKGKESATLDDYHSLVRDEFGIRLRYSLKMSKFADLFPFFFDLGIANEAVLDKFIDIALYKSSYKDLMKWLLPRIPNFALKHVAKKLFH